MYKLLKSFSRLEANESAVGPVLGLDGRAPPVPQTSIPDDVLASPSATEDPRTPTVSSSHDETEALAHQLEACDPTFVPRPKLED